jgi:GNAT superfamily N-acetyltransferase
MVTLLEKKHDRAAFSCGEPSLDGYLKRQASQDMRRRAAITYVMTAVPDERTIVGYYTLSSASVHLEELPEATVRKLARYPQVGASLLGRLAVGQPFKGQGFGARLLRDALVRCLEQSKRIAAAAFLVDALDEDALHFYERYGFLHMPGHPMKLYLPMATIERSLA